MKTFIPVLFMTSLVMSSCKTIAKQPNISDIKGIWTVTELMSEKIDRSQARIGQGFPSFQITDTSFYGSDGCNSFYGTWELHEEKLKFDKGMATLLSCPRAKVAYDYLFNEAVSRNQIWEKRDDGAYHLRRDLPPEYRDWRITEAAYLELMKDGEVTLRAKSMTAK